MFLIKVYGANHYDIQAYILVLNASASWEAPGGVASDEALGY